jgi:hypothetical protein
MNGGQLMAGVGQCRRIAGDEGTYGTYGYRARGYTGYESGWAVPPFVLDDT